MGACMLVLALALALLALLALLVVGVTAPGAGRSGKGLADKGVDVGHEVRHRLSQLRLLDLEGEEARQQPRDAAVQLLRLLQLLRDGGQLLRTATQRGRGQRRRRCPLLVLLPLLGLLLGVGSRSNGRLMSE